MTTEQFLQMIFNGYVTTYRKNNWHTTAKYSDMTHKELNFFIQLGESLGFMVRREMNWSYPRDLCWCDGATGDKPYLYLERENQDGQAEYTIEKILNPDNSRDIPILVSVFGNISKETLKNIKSLIRNKLPESQYFLMISWPPENENVDEDDNDIVEGWIFSKGQETVRTAKANMDKGGYWFIFFDKSDKGWM